MTATPDPRYPIGRVAYDPEVTPGKRTAWIRQIAEAPGALRTAIAGLSDEQLNQPYRPGGWSIRQVAHHVPDSHLNAYIRFKWALTEDNPTIKPYDQGRWADLADSRLTPVPVSLDLLDAVHRRFVVLLESLKDDDWTRPFVHPENGPMTLDQLLQLYAWHGRHHTAQITAFRTREGL